MVSRTSFKHQENSTVSENVSFQFWKLLKSEILWKEKVKYKNMSSIDILNHTIYEIIRSSIIQRRKVDIAIIQEIDTYDVLECGKKIISSHRYVVDHHDVFKSSLSNKSALSFFFCCICFFETQKNTGFCIRRYWISVDEIFLYISLYFKCPISFLLRFSQRVFFAHMRKTSDSSIICSYYDYDHLSLFFRAFFYEMIWKICWWDLSNQNHIYVSIE